MVEDQKTDLISLVLVTLGAAALLVLHSRRAAIALLIGGGLSFISFHWLKQAVDFVALKGGTERVGKRVALKYAGRYALIALTLYVTLRFSILDPVLVLAGLLVYVLAVLLESIFEIGKSLIRD